MTIIADPDDLKARIHTLEIDAHAWRKIAKLNAATIDRLRNENDVLRIQNADLAAEFANQMQDNRTGLALRDDWADFDRPATEDI